MLYRGNESISTKDGTGEKVSINVEDGRLEIKAPYKDLDLYKKNEIEGLEENTAGRWVSLKIEKPESLNGEFDNHCIVNGSEKELIDELYFYYHFKAQKNGNKYKLKIKWGEDSIESLKVIYIDSTDIYSTISDSNSRKILKELINQFRTSLHDYDAEFNILNGKNLEFKDEEVMRYLLRGLSDLNKGSPATNYTLFNFPREYRGLLVDGGVIFSLIGKGLLNLRNQVNYNDSGLSVNLFDKTGGFQSWGQFLIRMYMEDKKDFKTSVIPNSFGSGFAGIGSEFGYPGWGT